MYKLLPGNSVMFFPVSHPMKNLLWIILLSHIILSTTSSQISPLEVSFDQENQFLRYRDLKYVDDGLIFTNGGECLASEFEESNSIFFMDSLTGLSGYRYVWE